MKNFTLPEIKEIKHWSIHAAFCSTPNFLLALMGGYSRLESIVAMLFTIACFIFVYASFSSSSAYKNDKKPTNFRKAIRLGAKIRSGISLAGILGFIPSMFGLPVIGAIFMAPDMYAGMLAIFCSSFFFKYPSPFTRYASGATGLEAAGFYDILLTGRADAFIPTVVTTAIEGLIITLSILIITYTIIFFRSIKSRRPK